MKRIILIIAALTVSLSAFADEGMWLLPLIRQMNGKDLKEAGCKLSPKEIYDINRSSLKDAIVHFGGGCTGEMISDQGLLVTNHHCGYGSIQALSSDEHNYLMDGYWANERGEEIPVPGLSVTFLVSMEDVTARVEGADDKAAVRKEIISKATGANPGCRATVTGFYNDNVWYLIITRTYTDIRFVAAPPASMGKFGGETDNWMWPRHTCDFSMFRVYAGPDNMPAEYSLDNVPYRPAHSLKVSLKGIQEDDYAMIMGYPGRTQRYQTATQLNHMIARNRIAIDARTVRQDIMWEAMCADPSVQLKYANKYAGSANGWKKWQGEELSFKKLDIIAREEEKEEALQAWIDADPARKALYGTPMTEIAACLAKTSASELDATLLSESINRIELLSPYSTLTSVMERAKRDGKDEQEAFASAKERMKGFYRNYVPELDRKEAEALLEFYRERAKPEYYPVMEGYDFATMDIPAYVDDLFERSLFTSPEKMEKASLEELNADPAGELYKAVRKQLTATGAAGRTQANPEFDSARKRFAAALMDWQKGRPMYPDANSTMRLTYGHVLPYSPKDGLKYLHYTTLKGVIEKEDPTNPEFIVPERVKALYEAGDYGRWADADGTLHTCFLTNNDITGGNSGSPVLDARGNLIGLAFDGNWESMSSDVMFEPELQRCICVDIRYVLWMVEKYGGATNLIREITYVK